LNGGGPVRNTQPVTSAVLLHGGLNNAPPEGEVDSLSIVVVLITRATIGPPLQPGSSKPSDKEVEQASEGDTNDGVDLAAVLVAIFIELMVKQRTSAQCSSLEGVGLGLLVSWINGVEVDFRQVAVEVLAQDFAAGVEAVAAKAMLELLLIRQRLKPEKVLSCCYINLPYFSLLKNIFPPVIFIE
jgi:hypothetical protein